MFYSLKNLKNMGVKVLGTNIQINKSVKIYNPTKLTFLSKFHNQSHN